MINSKARRAMDLLLYVGISILVVVCIFAVARSGIHASAFVSWLSFGVFTLMLFGYFIADSHAFWRQQKFWGMCSVFFVLHGVGFAVLLRELTSIKPIWFLAVFGEMLVFVFCRDRVLSGDS